MKDLAIKMTPQGVIAGKVLDQDGDPVAIGAGAGDALRVSARPQATAANRRCDDQRSGRVSPRQSGARALLHQRQRSPRRHWSSRQDRPGRAGAGQEGNITTLLSEWSGCLQRRPGGCRGRRRNARHRYPFAPGEGLHRSRQSCGCIRRARRRRSWRSPGRKTAATCPPF